MKRLTDHQRALAAAHAARLGAYALNRYGPLLHNWSAAEIRSEAWLVVVDAAALYNPAYGVPFPAYAWSRITLHMRRPTGFSRAGRPVGPVVVRLPRHLDPVEDEDPPASTACVEDLVGGLPSHLARVVRWRAEGWTLARIGRRLGLSESRASLLLTEAVELIRKRLRGNP